MFEQEFAAQAEPAAAAAQAEPAAAGLLPVCKGSCWFTLFTPFKPQIVYPGPDDDPDIFWIDPVDLPVLRAHLEAQQKRIEGQLNEVKAAEQALKDRERTVG